MLVKFYGNECQNDSGKCKSRPRLTYLTDGLFRITQPAELNDQYSEFRFLPYFNKYSKNEIEWARQQEAKSQLGNFQCSEDDLITRHLAPCGVRAGSVFPALLPMGKSMADLDLEEFNTIVGTLNKMLLALSSSLWGVFSLTNNPTSSYMWTHYASSGEGVALVFNRDHPFFKQNHKPTEVSYDDDKRPSFTYIQGKTFINGHPVNIKESYVPKTVEETIKVLGLSRDYLLSLAKKIIYSKAAGWCPESEERIIFQLNQRDDAVGPAKNYLSDIHIPDYLTDYVTEHPAICLKKFPFDSFHSLVFGYRVANDTVAEARSLVAANPELKHIKFQQAKYNLFGQLELKDLD